jgi:hypothetical protein
VYFCARTGLIVAVESVERLAYLSRLVDRVECFA